MNTNSFGYPSECNLCKGDNEWQGLKVTAAFYKHGGERKLMLIGQDPTIRKDKDRVKAPLMLDDENSQISRWLKGIIRENLYKMTLYATNIVKCTFNMPPANQADGGYKFLSKYFNNCKKYLFQEIEVFKPDMVITLGEPSHIFFMSLFDKTGKDYKMKNDFTGKFEQMTSPNGREFFYSPCLHIQTFRVAETYGNAVKSFKQGLKEILAENNGFPPARE